MAKDYSSKDAAALVDEHSRILGQLTDAAAISAKAATDADSAAKSLIDNNLIRNHIIRSATHPDAAGSAIPGDDRLLRELYKFIRSQPVSERCRRLLIAQNDGIEQKSADIRQYGGGFRRVFASSKNKEKADLAFSFLHSLLNGEYGNAAREILSDVSAIQNALPEEIRSDFDKNKGAYQYSLYQIDPKINEYGSAISEFSEIKRKHNELIKINEGHPALIEKSRRGVADAVARLRSLYALQILKGVSVDEINREKSGIRVKTLKDSGFETMADVFTASVRRLAGVNGISEEAALEIKDAANSFAERSTENVKISLSADRKDAASTFLICAIYSYIKKTNTYIEYKNYYEPYGAKIEQYIKILGDVGNGIDWIFYTESERKAVIDAYNYLLSMLGGEFAQTIRNVDKFLSGETQRDAEAWQDFESNTVRYFNVIEEIVPNALGNDDGMYGLPEDLAFEIQDEEISGVGLKCTLRRYQEWGVKYALHQGKVLLGDEMGLGKTIQAIATMVSLSNTGETHFVVVCPASVLTNWCREIEEHSTLSVVKVHGIDRDASLNYWIKTGGVAVTTYETTAHFELGDNLRFGMLVVDEAHYVKNPEAARTVNVKKLCLKTDKLLFMTGTALENRVDEMISLIEILNPQIAYNLKDVAFMSNAPQFRQRVAPVYYRRKREDVLTELPEKTESKEWCTLSEEEKRLYEDAVLSKKYADIRRVSWNVQDVNESSKAQRMKELIDEATADGRKIIVFSFFLDTIRKVCLLLGNVCYGPINGSLPPQRRQEIIDEFDKAPPGSVLASQIQSGGTGLNIQSASVVIICEPQFKPSTENQAISRAYRMGQARNVLVYRLLCDDTVDERITDILKQKQETFDAFADQSVAADESVELDEKTFGDIIAEEIERIKAERGISDSSGESDLA